MPYYTFVCETCKIKQERKMSFEEHKQLATMLPGGMPVIVCACMGFAIQQVEVVNHQMNYVGGKRH